MEIIFPSPGGELRIRLGRRGTVLDRLDEESEVVVFLLSLNPVFGS